MVTIKPKFSFYRRLLFDSTVWLLFANWKFIKIHFSCTPKSPNTCPNTLHCLWLENLGLTLNDQIRILNVQNLVSSLIFSLQSGILTRKHVANRQTKETLIWNNGAFPLGLGKYLFYFFCFFCKNYHATVQQCINWNNLHNEKLFF